MPRGRRPASPTFAVARSRLGIFILSHSVRAFDVTQLSAWEVTCREYAGLQDGDQTPLNAGPLAHPPERFNETAIWTFGNEAMTVAASIFGGKAMDLGAPLVAEAIRRREPAMLVRLRLLRCAVDTCNNATKVLMSAAYVLRRYGEVLHWSATQPNSMAPPTNLIREKEFTVHKDLDSAFRGQRRDLKQLQASGILFAALGLQHLKLALCNLRDVSDAIRAAAGGLFARWGVAFGIAELEVDAYRSLCANEAASFCTAVDTLVEIPWGADKRRYHFKMFKIRAMRLSPFETTLFLDNDATLLPRRISYIEVLKERFDAVGVDFAADHELGGCQTAACQRRRLDRQESCRLPSWRDRKEFARLRGLLREVNTGTMLLRNTSTTQLFLTHWEHVVALGPRFVPGHGLKDQPGLVIAYGDTLPTYARLVDLLPGFGNPRSCCVRCANSARWSDWQSADDFWGFNVTAPGFPLSPGPNCRCLACHDSHSSHTSHKTPAPSIPRHCSLFGRATVDSAKKAHASPNQLLDQALAMTAPNSTSAANPDDIPSFQNVSDRRGDATETEPPLDRATLVVQGYSAKRVNQLCKWVHTARSWSDLIEAVLVVWNGARSNFRCDGVAEADRWSKTGDIFASRVHFAAHDLLDNHYVVPATLDIPSAVALVMDDDVTTDRASFALQKSTFQGEFVLNRRVGPTLSMRRLLDDSAVRVAHHSTSPARLVAAEKRVCELLSVHPTQWLISTQVCCLHDRDLAR